MASQGNAAAQIGLGNGLIEIAALTTLVGTTTASSLALGSRGAAGLPWAAISLFGALHVAKVCISAVIPGWLRNVLGVQSSETDLALGWSLDLASTHRGRNRIGSAIGIACEVPPLSKKKSVGDDGQAARARDLYQFDQFTSEHLKFIPVSGPKDPLQVHVLTDDAYRKNKTDKIRWMDSLGLVSSAIKLVEIAILWIRGALPLALVSIIPWAWFFLGAIALHSLNISRELLDDAALKADLLAGQLPTPIRAGGDRRILMGAPTNHRHRWIWTVVWAIGAVVSITSVVGCYLSLGQQTSDTVYLFLCMQVLWLALRSIFFHFSEGSDRVFNHPSLTMHTWDQLPYSYKSRVRELVFSLSSYEIHVHPRGAYSYTDQARKLENLPTIRLELPRTWLPRAEADSKFKLRIEAVVGDPILSSAAWVFGSKLNSIDYYDSCIVILKQHGTDIAIPSARVITDTRPDKLSDVEEPWDVKYPPRGGSNSGTDAVHWNYWIPLEGGTWFHFRTDNFAVVGEVHGTITTSEQVTKQLASGELFNSLTKVDEINEIVDHSRTGCRILATMLE